MLLQRYADWVRTDVTLSSEDERHRIVLKFWGEQISRTTDVYEGEKLLATAMVTGKWKHHPVHLNPTDETTLTASAMDAREKRLTIRGFDNDKSDNTVGLPCDNDMAHTMSTSLHYELQHLPHSLDVDAHVKGTHITQCSVAEDDDFEATEGEIQVGGHQHNLEKNVPRFCENTRRTILTRGELSSAHRMYLRLLRRTCDLRINVPFKKHALIV